MVGTFYKKKSYLDRDLERDCVRLLISIYEIGSICEDSLSLGDDGIEWIEMSESESFLIGFDVDSDAVKTPVPKAQTFY